MAEKPIADVILSEAEGAHRTSREILMLMQEPVDDPILVILDTLRRIEDRQYAILARLETMERTLAQRTP
jgi:hypothetical protein